MKVIRVIKVIIFIIVIILIIVTINREVLRVTLPFLRLLKKQFPDNLG